MSMHAMSDEKNKLLMHCYANIKSKMHLSILTFQKDGAS